MTYRIFFGSTGRHINRNIHHHYGFNNVGGWVLFNSDVAEFDVRGSVGDEFAGGKFWDTAAERYVQTDVTVFHFRGGFTQPPGPLEICGTYSDEPDNSFMHAAHSLVTIVLDEDAHFRAYTDWTIGQPGDGTLLGTSTHTADLDPADPDDGGGSLFSDPVSPYLHDYVIYIKHHATAGRVILWEDGIKVWDLQDVNTVGGAPFSTAFAWTVGQRGSINDGLSQGAPFPASASFYWRFERLVIADVALGRINFHTLFANREGEFTQFPLVNPEPWTETGGMAHWEALRDDPDRDFNPSPDEINTFTAQDGSANGEMELVGFEELPALASDEIVVGVGLSVYMAGSEGNQATYVFRSQVSPTIHSGDVALLGDARDLFDANEAIFVDNYVPFPDPSLQARESGLGFFGWLPYVDWYPTRDGIPWIRDDVNAIEGGVQTFFRACWLSQVVLLVVTATPLCEGDPGNPYPNPPPVTPEVAGIYANERAQWNLATVPETPGSSLVAAVERGQHLRAALIYVHTGYAWALAAIGEDTGDPPVPGPWPPNFDPCEIAPPIETPPDVTIGAPPDRLFFTWAITASQLGPLWTATYRAMGQSILGEISQAAARSSAIFGTPGDKTKFFTGGRYDPDKMDAWIFSLAPLASTVMAAQTAGSFAGVHAADDWENAAKWPPVGLPLLEINRIAGVWKSVFGGGLRVMLRARSNQIGGTSLPNIDGLISQMRHRGSSWDEAGHSAAAYAATELSFCQARGWILHLSNNVYEGEQNGVTLTAAEVLANGLDWVSVAGSHPHGGAVYGMGTWQFAPRGAQNATGPDYLNAYAGWRNAMVPLGPPTFP